MYEFRWGGNSAMVGKRTRSRKEDRNVLTGRRRRRRQCKRRWVVSGTSGYCRTYGLGFGREVRGGSKLRRLGRGGAYEEETSQKRDCLGRGCGITEDKDGTATRDYKRTQSR